MHKTIYFLYSLIFFVIIDLVFHEIIGNYIHHHRYWELLFIIVSLVVVFINYNQTKKINIMQGNLVKSEQRYRSLFKHHPDGLSALDLKGNFINVNQASLTFSGYDNKKALLKINLFDVVLPEELEKTKNHFYIASKGSASTFESVAIDYNNNKVFMIVTMIPIWVNDEVEGVYAVTQDITERKKAQEKINHLAFRDSLTNLPNRRIFEDKVTAAISEVKLNKKAGYILFLDLDGFKIINDSLGHNVGDLLLKEVSYRLTTAVPDNVLVARHGGDEFAILITQESQKKTLDITKNILSEFKTSFTIQGNEFFMTPSIGISCFPLHGEEVKTLIEKADTAMYQAKKQGKNGFHFYDKDHGHTISRLPLETELRKAIERQEFTLYYQERVNLKTGYISGLEALIRWKHPSLGFIPPSEFISIAEETGLILPIGKWVLRTACAQSKAWQNSGYPPLIVSVNLSIKQLHHPSFINDVIEILSDIGLKPEHLELELTETMAMDINKISVILFKLKEIGVKISIDDFGTGYSSLAYLKHLPIDTLKIDQSFIRDITSDPNDRSIVETIIGMSKNLGLRVTAEGVETKEQLDFLNSHDCDEAQGYYFNKPKPVEEIETTLINRSTNSR